MKLRKMLAALALLAPTGAACTTDADVASKNLSKAADQFEVHRRIVFINGITDEYLLEITGLCSIGNTDTAERLSVTCKTGEDEYRKHYLGLSDNVTFLVEHLEPTNVSDSRYRVVFKPSVIVPDVEID